MEWLGLLGYLPDARILLSRKDNLSQEVQVFGDGGEEGRKLFSQVGKMLSEQIRMSTKCVKLGQ